MARISGRNEPLRLFGRRLLLLALVILVGSAAFETWSVFQKERESARLDKEAQAELAELKDRQARLQNDYDSLQTNRGVEAALRDQYAMGKAGEGMVVIVEPQQPAPVEATTSLSQWFADMFSHL
jgi:cell division protein FtsB